MAITGFLTFLGLSLTVALSDWRRGWYFAFLCAVLQDPVRKMAAGNPLYVSFSVVVVYAVIIMSARVQMRQGMMDLSRRFASTFQFWNLLAVFLLLGAVNGLITYGLPYWAVPTVSFVIYLLPFTAVLFGYVWTESEKSIERFLTFFAAVTSVLLVGTLLEYWKFKWRALGIVGIPEGFIRHLPGIQIRLLSGFYRGADIMAWHAAMLTAVSLAFAVKRRTLVRAWPWMILAGWGFLNCILSGRRKAVYMAVVFTATFLLSYIRRIRLVEAVGLALTIGVMILVMQNVAEDSGTSVYARGTVATQQEFFQRLEGGTQETIRQFGFFGAGLGSATQGVYHFLGDKQQVGWQESGLSKLTIELGVPGVLAVLVFGLALFRLLWKITKFPDEPASAQATRALLFGVTVANVANFAASAQTYSDPGITLTTAFFVGALLATARMENPAPAIPPATLAIADAPA